MLFTRSLLQAAGNLRDRRNTQDDFLFTDLFVRQIGPERFRYGVDSQIDLTVFHGLIQGSDTVFHNIDLVLGMHPLKIRQDIGQNIAATGWCNADGKRASRFRTDIRECIVKLMVQIQNFKARFHVLPACISQVHFIVYPAEKLYIQAVFQILQKFGKRRLGYIEKTGSTGQCLIFFNCQDILYFTEIHTIPPFLNYVPQV